MFCLFDIVCFFVSVDVVLFFSCRVWMFYVPKLRVSYFRNDFKVSYRIKTLKHFPIPVLMVSSIVMGWFEDKPCSKRTNDLSPCSCLLCFLRRTDTRWWRIVWTSEVVTRVGLFLSSCLAESVLPTPALKTSDVRGILRFWDLSFIVLLK